MNLWAKRDSLWGRARWRAPGLGFALGGCLALGFPFALGCGDPLVDPALVAGPRVLGARVLAMGDALVAEPGAGESASIEWLVVSNERAAFWAALSFCAAEPSVLGAPRCRGAAFGEQVVEGLFGTGIAAEFQLPAELQPGDTWLAWFGSCGATPASFDDASSEFHCSDGSEPRSAFYRGRVPGGGSPPNQNPELDDDRLWLDAEPWAGAAAPRGVGEPCQGSELPQRQAGARVAIAFELAGDDREALDAAAAGDYAPRARESLVYTHVASLAGLERPFSAIEHDGVELGFDVELALDPTEAIDPQGHTLVFYLLVRDERGGVDWTQRELCVSSP
jgi:hypothetical protein